MTAPIRVLLVEDDEDVRLSVSLFLQHLKFEVATASDGQEALYLLAVAQLDVILLDLHMPVMDGVEFLRQYVGKVPVVVMSGWADTTELPCAVFAKIMKPMSMSEVAPILKTAAATKQ